MTNTSDVHTFYIDFSNTWTWLAKFSDTTLHFVRDNNEKFNDFFTYAS